MKQSKVDSERPRRVLLIENSVNIYNSVVRELAPFIDREAKPFVDLVFTGEDRPANRVDITADDAMLYYERGPFDLVIADLALRPVYSQRVREALLREDPDGVLCSALDGLLVVARIRTSAPELPIIVFSRYASEEVVKRALRRLLNGLPEGPLVYLEKGDEDYARLAQYVLVHLGALGSGLPTRGVKTLGSGLTELIERLIASCEPPTERP